MSRRLRVGLAGPISGPRAAYGALIREVVASAEPWFDPVWGDDMANVPQAESVAWRFVVERVDAVIGHFNSDCARAAGAIYRMAGIPFLMPASTANDLTESTDAIRICADDTKQIDALAQWLAGRGERLAEIWEDGSPYAARLAAAIRARGLIATSSVDPEAPVGLLGAHHSVAREMQARRRFAGPVFVPDDCAIPDFACRLKGVEANVLCAHAQPDFTECVHLALALLRDASEQSVTLAEALNQHPSLARRQYIRAGFVLHFTVYLQADYIGNAS